MNTEPPRISIWWHYKPWKQNSHCFFSNSNTLKELLNSLLRKLEHHHTCCCPNPLCKPNPLLIQQEFPIVSTTTTDMKALSKSILSVGTRTNDHQELKMPLHIRCFIAPWSHVGRKKGILMLGMSPWGMTVTHLHWGSGETHLALREAAEKQTCIPFCQPSSGSSNFQGEKETKGRKEIGINSHCWVWRPDFAKGSPFQKPHTH